MKLISALAVVFLLFCSQAFSSPYRGGGSPIPAQAAAAGYKTNTFSIRNNFNTSTVDTHCTLASGFLAYNNNLNYGTCDYVGSGTVLNADGSAYVPTNSTMSSISRLTSPPYYVGNAFGGGGYFEAELFFNPAWAGPTNWPAWWLMSAEKLAADFGDQWPGQVTGYNHFMEVDTMEFFAGSSRSYNSTLIDWWGLYNTTCSKYCSLSTNSYPGSNTTYGVSNQGSISPVPKGTDWTGYHRYGVLWIPATVSTQGSYQFYFDDIPVGTKMLYSQYTTQSPPPTTSTPWTFGIGDQQHLAWLLGDLNVRSINVWQASAANNLHN